ncbi:MAG: leucyl aminopeptidase [Gammaproteobacteria bacterium]|nr:leucyl aminopeptidase [Gammaproteobacteria bacterium]
MEFTAKSGHPEKQRTACLVVGVFEPRRLSPAAEKLDEASGGFISNLLRRGDLEGKLGQILFLHNVPNTLCDRVLLVGCGKERDLHDTQYRKIIATAANTLNESGAMEAVCCLTEIHVKGRDGHWNIRQAVEAFEDALYTFDQFKSKKDAARRPLRKVVLSVGSRRDLPDGERAVAEGYAIAQGVKLTKDLGNLPANICTPTYLAEQAQQLAKDHAGIQCEVMHGKEIEAFGMGSFWSVAKGSRQEPKFITLRYQGDNAEQKPIVLVGKGITFDSGGISIKPAANMDEMKYDMCGAASVIGTFRAMAELKLPLNVIGLIPTCENLPDGNANKPGDIVTSLSGQTIEVLNTDAEGRLILCDALTYAERFEPESVIDIATLTGACVVALGKHASGLLGNHSPLVNDLLDAGKTCGDRAWELPLWDEYQEQLNSPFADMANIGGKEAGTITAACFLSRFTKKFHWAHLDIAGSAWRSGDKKGATGRPVPLLTQFLLDRCAAK